MQKVPPSRGGGPRAPDIVGDASGPVFLVGFSFFSFFFFLLSFLGGKNSRKTFENKKNQRNLFIDYREMAGERSLLPFLLKAGRLLTGLLRHRLDKALGEPSALAGALDLAVPPVLVARVKHADEVVGLEREFARVLRGKRLAKTPQRSTFKEPKKKKKITELKIKNVRGTVLAERNSRLDVGQGHVLLVVTAGHNHCTRSDGCSNEDVILLVLRGYNKKITLFPQCVHIPLEVLPAVCLAAPPHFLYRK